MELSFSPQTDFGLIVYAKYPNNVNIFNIDLASVSNNLNSPHTPPFHRMLCRILKDLYKSAFNSVERFAINHLLNSSYVEFKFSKVSTHPTMVAIVIITPYKSTFLFESDSVLMSVFKVFGQNIHSDEFIPEEQYIDRWNETPNNACLMMFNIYQIRDNEDSVNDQVILAFGVYRSSFNRYIKTTSFALQQQIDFLQDTLNKVDDVMLELGL